MSLALNIFTIAIAFFFFIGTITIIFGEGKRRKAGIIAVALGLFALIAYLFVLFLGNKIAGALIG